jgi:hypothetical protein
MLQRSHGLEAKLAELEKTMPHDKDAPSSDLVEAAVGRWIRKPEQYHTCMLRAAGAEVFFLDWLEPKIMRVKQGLEQEVCHMSEPDWLLCDELGGKCKAGEDEDGSGSSHNREELARFFEHPTDLRAKDVELSDGQQTRIFDTGDLVCDSSCILPPV